MRKLFAILLTVLSAETFLAQNETDALRYSQITFGGTARYNSMAGSFGALGADFSTLSSNPAGIALFRRNELSITPGMVRNTVQSKSGDASNSTDYTRFNFQNAGFVWVFNPFDEQNHSKWRYLSAGFGYNRLADFNVGMNMNVNNASGSMSDVFIHHANGTNPKDLDPFNEALAYDTYLIDNPKGGEQYGSYFQKVNVKQQKSVQTNGGMGETVISFGGNYSGKLYLGATLGIPHINYTENSRYSEKSGKDTAGMVRSFQFDQYVNTSGTGINFKLGGIYRATDWMRIGFTLHTPSSFSMHDNYSSSMTTVFKDSTNSEASPNGTYDYKLVTPARFIGSLGFIIAKKGLLNLDYELVDYSSARMSSSDAGAFNEPNTYVQKNYATTGNLRLGAEWRILSFLSVRGGFAYYGNPYRNGVNIDASRQSYCGGIGFRQGDFYADLAYVFTQYKENYYLNDPAFTAANAVSNSFNARRTMLTFGFRF